MSAGLPRVHSRRRLCGDGGAALLETALIAPVLFLLLFGVFEFGLVYRDMLTVNDAVGDGARIGGVVGNNVYASAPFTGENGDWFIVSAIRQSTAGLDANKIERIVVFQPDQDYPTRTSAIDLIPDACKSSNVSIAADHCNVYLPDQAFAAIEQGNIDYFKCGGSYTVACAYNPESKSERNSDPGSGAVATRYVGVYIKYDHQMITGWFGNDFSISEASIALIEPYDPNE